MYHPLQLMPSLMMRKSIATGQDASQASDVRIAIMRGCPTRSRLKAPIKGETINQPSANGSAVSTIWGRAPRPDVSLWLLRPSMAKMRKTNTSPIASLTMRCVSDISFTAGVALAAAVCAVFLLIPIVSLIPLILSFFLLLAHQFLHGGQLCPHTSNTHDDKREIDKEPNPCNSIGGNQIIYSLHECFLFIQRVHAGARPAFALSATGRPGSSRSCRAR